ncbi:hypothetical protein FO519_007625 [Halicephalobus sp. NKZ332]|nr:hypothetical protein FO519_007625 [Halicephalobus sp. NKZ332]
MAKSTTSDPSFDSYPEFRCCCNAVHVKHGTLIIGIFEFILIAFSFLTISVTKVDVLQKILEIFLVFRVAATILLFFSIRKEKSQLLLPYIVSQGICILISLVFITIGFSVFLDPQSKVALMMHQHVNGLLVSDNKEQIITGFQVRMSALCMIFFNTVMSLINIWCFSVAYDCYKYFKYLAVVRENCDVTIKHCRPIDV